MHRYFVIPYSRSAEVWRDDHRFARCSCEADARLIEAAMKLADKLAAERLESMKPLEVDHCD